MPKYYWRARGDASEIKPGWRVPIAKPRQTPVEALFESVRRKEFPQRPSRLNCVFVCPDLKGFCRLGNHDWDTGEPEYIFEVKVTGKTFTANAETFTSARDEISRDPAYTERIVRSYWEGVGKPYLPEILVDGTVTVVKRVQPPEHLANKIAQAQLNKQAGGKVIVVDVQPAYKRWINDPQDTMKFLNGASQILCLFNGPDLGYEDEHGILEWWIENGFDPDKQYDVTWDEKGYAFFRDWMDGGVDPQTIAEVARYMIQNRISDSRDLNLEDIASDLGPAIAEEVEEANDYGIIGLPDIDLRTLKRFSGATLIGGACDQCLAEVEILLDALNISYRKNNRYIFASVSNVFQILNNAFDSHPAFTAVREADRVVVYPDSPLMARDKIFQDSVQAVILSLRKLPASQEINDYHVTQTFRRDGDNRRIDLIPKHGRENPIYDSRPHPADLPNDIFSVGYIYQPKGKPYRLLVTAIFKGGKLVDVLHQKNGKIKSLNGYGSKNIQPATAHEIRNAKPSKFR